jgi:hypothetical protein
MPGDKNPEETCFVIAPIGESGSEIRKRSDQVLKHVIRPAAKSCGFRAIRADEISEPGIITTQVLQHIVDDPMVVADLTGQNPNVFYELAVRHSLRRPYVQIIQRGERIPFDVAGVRTIEVDHRDLDSVEAAKQEIQKQMEASAGGAEIESPISVAADLDRLRKSENPEERQLADVLAAISDLRLGLASVQKSITEPTNLIPPGYLRELLFEAIEMGPRSVTPRYLHEMRSLLVQLRENLQDSKPEQQERTDMLLTLCNEMMHRMRFEFESGPIRRRIRVEPPSANPAEKA